MMQWYTSDLHLNHGDCISKFIFRPFRDTAHMNAELIKRHNERVNPGHTVFIIGDFKISSDGPNTHELIGMLNGSHVFIAGNHDKRNGLNTPLKSCVIESYGRKIVLAHKPEDCDNLMGVLGIDLGFCGHVHTAWRFKTAEHGDLVNVGVDQWDFAPVDPKQIFKALKKWKRDGIKDESSEGINPEGSRMDFQGGVATELPPRQAKE
jgi:calcineurin-like phosphoesterase family protein